MNRRKVVVACRFEERAYALHRFLYAHNDTVDVLLAKRGAVVRDILSELEIDVLILDQAIYDSELLLWIASQATETRVVMLWNAPDLHESDRLLSMGCVEVMPDSSSTAQVALRVAELLADQTRWLHGSLSAMTTADLLQVLCLNRTPSALHVESDWGRGTVFVRDGEIIHAIWNDGRRGEDALFRCLWSDVGQFYTMPIPSTLPRTIEREWQTLIMDGMKRRDEERLMERAASLSAQSDNDLEDSPFAHPALDCRKIGVPRKRKKSRPPGWDAAPRESSLDSDSTRMIAQLVESGFSRLRAGDRDGAREAWENALRQDPNNRALELNLRRLDAAKASPQA